MMIKTGLTLLLSVLLVLCGCTVEVFGWETFGFQDATTYFASSPVEDPKSCGMEEPSFFCDPGKVVANPGDRLRIAEMLADVENETKFQLAVAVMKSSESYSTGEKAVGAAQTILDTWGVGDIGTNNGIVLFLGMSSRKFGIYAGF